MRGRVETETSVMRDAGRLWRVGVAGLVASVLALLAAASAAAAATPAGQVDVGGFRSVLGLGQGQTVNAADLAQFEATGVPPGPFTNQFGLYTGIIPGEPGLSASTLDRYYKNSGFRPAGVDAGSVETPRPGLTIVRDPAFRVPRIYGATRSDTMFGAGYATAEDRLFLMDALRHTARASTVELLGPSAARADAAQLTHQDFSEDELNRDFDSLSTLGPEGQQGKADFLDYISGINAYIDAARSDPRKLPAEYPALGVMPQSWTRADSMALAIFLISQFTANGGGEDHNAIVLRDAERRFRARLGRRVFDDFRRAEDPEAAVVTPQAFRSDRPGRVNARAVALPDGGSVVKRDAIVSGGSGAAAAARTSSLPAWARTLATRGLPLAHHASNALLVDARHSRTGRPLAAMGPQVGYYSPEIFNEYELHGPGVDVSGVSFPGASPYPLIGHGRDFAWTGTTANGDTVDTFAERLCNPDGSPPSSSSTHYLYRGRCVPFVMRDQVMRTPASPLDPTATPRTVTLRAQRSVHGTVIDYARVHGRPVALTESHATSFHEVQSLLAFKRLAENRPTDGPSFQRAMRAFYGNENWFYLDNRNIAWIQTGSFPVHARGTDLDLPIWGTGPYDWRGFDPRAFTYRRLSYAHLPKAVNPKRGYLISWNNKEARGWRAPAATWSFGPLQRSLLLERPLRAALRRHRKLALVDVSRISTRAAAADLRVTEDLGWLLRTIGRLRDRPTAALVRVLAAWRRDGAQRRDVNGNGFDENGPAIALMDAWWPRLVRGMFQPVLGARVVDAIRDEVNPLPDRATSTFFFDGWYGYVQKDLRRILRRPERGRFSRVYCGRGSLRRCRAALLSTLKAAAASVRTRYGSSDMAKWTVRATCPKTDPPSCDQIVPITAGAIPTPPFAFHNRGTFHQLVEVLGRRHG